MNGPTFYAIIPANVRYCKGLKANAKLLYGEITALCNKDGYCWAENSYFADLYEVSEETVSRWISQLKSFGFISIRIENKGGFVRKISLDEKINSLDKNVKQPLTKSSTALDEKVIYNNTINNTIKNKSALDFLIENSPSMYEAFEMKFKKQILDFEKFKMLFNCKYDEEDLEYSTKKINARLTRFAINYVGNENKQFGQQNQNQQPNEPAYRKNII